MKHLLLLLLASSVAIFSKGQIHKNNFPDHLSPDNMEVFGGKSSNRAVFFEYDTSNNIQSLIVNQSDNKVKQQLDSTIQKSVLGPNLYVRTMYNYDTHGSVIRERTYEINANLIRYRDIKSEYVYDIYGNEIQIIMYNWNKDLNQYEGSQKIDKLINSTGNITQETSYSWDTNVSQWIASYKNEYQLNSSGKDTLRIGYTWDQNAGQWINNSKEEKVYDSQGQPTFVFWYRWDQNLSQWINSSKEESLYDAQGNNVKYTSYQWNPDYKKWDYDMRLEYTFNDLGKLTRRTGYIANGYGSFRVLDRWDYTYGTDGKTVEMIGSWDRLGLGHLYTDTKIEEEYDVNGYCIHSKRYRFIEPNQWELKDYVDRYYSVIQNSGISNPTTDVIKAYPNPATEYITFNLSDAAKPAIIELYDMQGKKIISQILASDNRVEVSQLKSGMYIYKISQNKKIFQGKVSIK